MKENKLSVYIVGGGRIGTMLAHHLQVNRIPILGIAQRNTAKRQLLSRLFPHIPIHSRINFPQLEQANLLFLSVQDDQLPATIEKLNQSNVNFKDKIVLHTSGVHDSRLLTPLQQKGALIASAHPNVAVASMEEEPQSLEGVYWDVEGAPEACKVCEALFATMGCHIILITPQQKTPMHLAAVIYSNFSVVLAELAQAVLTKAEIPKQYHWAAFQGLMESTIQNLSHHSPAEALTGPMVRGDVNTIRKHLEFLKEKLPEGIPPYLALLDSVLERFPLPGEIKEQLLKLSHEYRNTER